MQYSSSLISGKSRSMHCLAQKQKKMSCRILNLKVRQSEFPRARFARMQPIAIRRDRASCRLSSGAPSAALLTAERRTEASAFSRLTDVSPSAGRSLARETRTRRSARATLTNGSLDLGKINALARWSTSVESSGVPLVPMHGRWFCNSLGSNYNLQNRARLAVHAVGSHLVFFSRSRHVLPLSFELDRKGDYRDRRLVGASTSASHARCGLLIFFIF